MDGDFFFVFGIVLVIAAVGLAFLGIRESDRFPGSRAVLVGVTAVFAAAVVTTMAFAVVKSQDEQKKRNEELAKEGEQAQPENTGEPVSPGGQPQASSGGNQQPAQTTGGATASETLDVSSPADGGLIFEPDGLTAKPGNVTITYDNPSPVAHSIAVATANGNVLGEVQPFTDGTQSVDLANLAPGKYVFYCTVPGHREAGMQGNLTVTGGP
ncbi:MAG TPA: cupredoxin domain-containing protein [Solirubrobacterales bacterium]